MRFLCALCLCVFVFPNVCQLFTNRCTYAERLNMSKNSSSRREFLAATAAGLTGASLAATPLSVGHSATPAEPQELGDGRRRRILKGGVVLSLDSRVGDFEKADVLIDGKLIADVGPNISAGDAEVVDCSGTIVMPGFVT